MSLVQPFLAHWRRHFSSFSGPFLLAFSGGVDSVVLAHLLHEAQLPFGLAHVNFQLREAESDGDEQFAMQYAKQRRLPYFSTRFNTLLEAETRKMSLQEAARALRYAWLHEVRAAHSFTHLLTAHQANDQAETLFINLLRGTGVAGLRGIVQKQPYLLRPMLFASRERILTHALEYGLEWREDSSNQSDKYLRNAIRHHVMPALAAVMPDAVDRINANMLRFAEVEIIYNKAISQLTKKLIEKRGNDWYVPLRKLRPQEPLATICLELFRPFGFTPAQLPDILQLLHAETGRYLVSDDYIMLRNREFLIITRRTTMESDLIQIDSLPAEITTTEFVFNIDLIESANFLTGDPTVAFLDAAACEAPLVLRRPRTGDYFYPLGMAMKKKKLSRFLIDQKAPLHEKSRLWILESNRRIAWVVGRRIDERFKCAANTQKVIRVRVELRTKA